MTYQSIILKTNKTSLSDDDLKRILTEKLNIVVANNFERVEVRSDTKAIKIEQVRDSISKIWTKSDNLKLFIIIEAEKMTEDSQNFLLKSIEEPPSNTIIVLVSQNPYILLGTIRSRCLIVDGVEQSESIDNEEIENFVDKLSKNNYIERVKVLDEILKDENSREKGLQILDKLIRISIEKNSDIKIINELKEYYFSLKRSGNIKVIFENINITLDKVS